MLSSNGNALKTIQDEGHHIVQKILAANDGASEGKGRVIGIHYGGYNSNSGSIGSFVFVIPGLMFQALAVLSVILSVAACYLFRFFAEKEDAETVNVNS